MYFYSSNFMCRQGRTHVQGFAVETTPILREDSAQNLKIQYFFYFIYTCPFLKQFFTYIPEVKEFPGTQCGNALDAIDMYGQHYTILIKYKDALFRRYQNGCMIEDFKYVTSNLSRNSGILDPCQRDLPIFAFIGSCKR